MSPTAPPLRLRSTLRRGLVAWWDHLGLGVFTSIVAVGSSAFLAGAGHMLHGYLGPTLALCATPFLLVGVVTAVGAGVAQAAHAVVHREEVGPSVLVRIPRRMLGHAILLAGIQCAAHGLALANLWFYLHVRSAVGHAAAILLFYVWCLWLLACAYQWPILAASHSGVIPSASPGSPSLWAVIRNSLILIVSAPGYSLGFGIALLALNTPLILTGVGLALAAPALSAILAAQSVRDHLVRLGMVEPPDEGPVSADTWRVPAR